MRRLDWRFALLLFFAFLLWNLAVTPVMPLYAGLVVPPTQFFLNLIEPHGAVVNFADFYPYVQWQTTQTSATEQVSFQLVSYNVVLYLTCITALPDTSLRDRAVFLSIGLPVLYLFHIADLAMVVESRLLTALQPQHYDLWESFSLWFVMVKFYGSFSVLALKQILPLAMVYFQWQWLRRRQAGPSNAVTADGDA
ncbi:MAG: hypothetical protein IH940_04565 [Acidobacteria bacterium]|nr:hypothetical protein [Acidobacteriota bacterium]